MFKKNLIEKEALGVLRNFSSFFHDGISLNN